MKDFLRLKMIKYGEIYIEIKNLMFENEIKREKIGFQLLLIKRHNSGNEWQHTDWENTCKAYN